MSGGKLSTDAWWGKLSRTLSEISEETISRNDGKNCLGPFQTFLEGFWKGRREFAPFKMSISTWFLINHCLHVSRTSEIILPRFFFFCECPLVFQLAGIYRTWRFDERRFNGNWLTAWDRPLGHWRVSVYNLFVWSIRAVIILWSFVCLPHRMSDRRMTYYPVYFIHTKDKLDFDI